MYINLYKSLLTFVDHIKLNYILCFFLSLISLYNKIIIGKFNKCIIYYSYVCYVNYFNDLITI